jgi:hypothetical protein
MARMRMRTSHIGSFFTIRKWLIRLVLTLQSMNFPTYLSEPWIDGLYVGL